MSGAQIIKPDRQTYIRVHAWMAAAAMAAGMAILWLAGNPHIWTGAVGGLAAIAVRGWYLASDELAVEWELSATRLNGPGWRQMDLGEIETVRTLGSAVQVVTKGGDKHLLKYLQNPDAVRNTIEASIGAKAA